MKHCNFHNIKVPGTAPHDEVQTLFSAEIKPRAHQRQQSYAIAVGISAAAGTRFALQMILVRSFFF